MRDGEHPGLPEGAWRVDEKKMAKLNPTLEVLDQVRWRFDEVVAAAGHPHGVFLLCPQARVAEVAP